jgi:hypothetical protein
MIVFQHELPLLLKENKGVGLTSPPHNGLSDVLRLTAATSLPGLLPATLSGALSLALSLLFACSSAEARVFLQFIFGLELLPATVTLELTALIRHGTYLRV